MVLLVRMSAIAGCGILLSTACHNSPPPSGTSAPGTLPIVYMLVVPASPDSAIKLARFALGAIEGALQLPQVRSRFTSISTHYMRQRRGGGHTEVAVIAGVNLVVADTSHPATIVELRAWALDMPHQLTFIERRSGVPATAVTTNAPAIRTPRAITMTDTSDSRTLDFVLEAFVKHGARRLP